MRQLKVEKSTNIFWSDNKIFLDYVRRAYRCYSESSKQPNDEFQPLSNVNKSKYENRKKRSSKNKLASLEAMTHPVTIRGGDLSYQCNFYTNINIVSVSINLSSILIGFCLGDKSYQFIYRHQQQCSQCNLFSHWINLFWRMRMKERNSGSRIKNSSCN